MTRPLKIHVFPADQWGCGYYRMIWPARAVQEYGTMEGHTIVVETESRSLSAKIEGGKVIDAFVPDCDVVVFQRPTLDHLSASIPFIRRKGVAVVVDMDDNLSHIYPENPAFQAFHPAMYRNGRTKGHSWDHAQRACDTATLVTVSTPALLRQYARIAPGIVIKNCLPDHVFDTSHEDSDVIGYAGAIHSHANDIPMLGSSIARLMSGGLKFHTAADTTGIEKSLHLPRPVDHTAGPVDVLDWWGEIARFGIGVAPLADTQFNAGKSWLKPLEMAACRVPCVFSPRAEYRAIHEMGVGLLAKKPQEFYAHLSRLARDPVERKDLADGGWAAVRHLTFERQWKQWLDAWVHAWELQQAM